MHLNAKSYARTRNKCTENLCAQGQNTPDPYDHSVDGTTGYVPLPCAGERAHATSSPVRGRAPTVASMLGCISHDEMAVLG